MDVAGKDAVAALEQKDLLIPAFSGTESEIRQALAEGFRPSGRTDIPHWRFSIPIDWSADPNKDRNWQYQLHAWYLLRPHLALLSHKKDPAILREMVNVALDWHAFHVVRRRKALMSWKDMAVGRRAAIVAFLVGAVLRGEVEVSEEESTRLRDLWRMHFLRLIDDRNITMTNHGFAQIHGLMALCRLFPGDPETTTGLAFARRKFAELLKSQFGEDGVHKEHSPEYHFFVLNLVKGMLLTGWYSDFPEVVRLIRKSQDVASWLLMPDGRYISVGDSTASAVGGPSTPRPAFPAGDGLVMRKFDSGYGIIRSQGGAAPDRQCLLFFMGAFHSFGHKHADDLSVIWHDLGQDILIDPGKYSYSLGSWRNYFLSTRAHNTVEVDRRSYSRRNEDAYGSALHSMKEAAFGYVLDGHVFHHEMDTDHARQIAYSPHEWLVVVDRLQSPREHEYIQWFHFSPLLSVSENDGRYSATSDTVRVMISSVATGPFKTELVSGAIRPVMQGWTSEGYNKRVPCSTLGVSTRASNTVIVTVLRLGDHAAEARVRPDGVVEVFDGKGRVVLDPAI